MNFKIIKIIILSLFIFLSGNKIVFSEIIKDFKIVGNERISKETILMFS